MYAGNQKRDKMAGSLSKNGVLSGFENFSGTRTCVPVQRGASF
jgi:hypothetical protein